MSELDVQAWASLSASLDGLAAELRAERQRAAAAADCWYVQPPAIVLPAGNPFTYAPPMWGPNTGYCWAVQRMTAAFPGADTNDNVTVYRGHTLADIQGQNALNTLSQDFATQAVTWHPGRTGLVLMPDESLVFSGTIAGGSNGYISVDVIQVTLANLPALLL